MTDERRDMLAANLTSVQKRIADEAAAAGRDPGELTLIVVTKTFPASDVETLASLGVRHFGENRHPEAGDKASALAGLDLVWHFIGHVQSNKAAAIASYADVVHSVDSVRLAHRLGTSAIAHDRVVTCLLQVSLDPPGQGQGRSGVLPDELPELADAVADTDGLRLGGLMGIAPLGGSARPAFELLARCWHELRAQHPDADILSAGMSGDFPEAIRAGATHLRIGSAVVGERPTLG